MFFIPYICKKRHYNSYVLYSSSFVYLVYDPYVRVILDVKGCTFRENGINLRDSAERDFAATFSSLSDATPAPAHRDSKEGSGLTGSVYARPDPRDEQDTGSDDPMSASDREAARLTPRGSHKKGAQHRRLPALC